MFLSKGEAIVCNDSFCMEEKMIDALIEVNMDVLAKIFRIYMNNVFSVLLLLNDFEIENLFLVLSFEKQFKETAVWKEIEEHKNLSVIKYEEALRNNEYR